MYPSSLLPLISSFSVFPIWLLEQVIPYPYLIEELTKSLFIANTEASKNNPYKYAIISGFAYGLSETILYQIINIQRNYYQDILNRIAFVIPMHILTYIVLFAGFKRNILYKLLSILVAILIHYSFNTIST